MTEKKAGLAGLKRLIEKQVPFRTPELKKILESFRNILSGRGPLFLLALDVLADFLAVCGPVLDYPWCNFLVPVLTSRAADSSLPGQSLAAVFKARSAAIENLNPSLQIQALSKLIQSESDNQPRNKVQILVWLTQLAPRLDGPELQMGEVRIAISRIVQWGGELSRSNRAGAKNVQLRSLWNTKSMRKCAHESLLSLQNSCQVEFDNLLDSLPPTTSETARYLLSASKNGSRIQSKANSRATSPNSRKNANSRIPIQTVRVASSKPSLSQNSSRTTTPTGKPTNPSKMKKRSESDLSDKMTKLDISPKSSTISGSLPVSRSPPEEPEVRPPPSPEEPSGQSNLDCQSDPILIFADQTAAASDRLAALESIEPELLDETEIGRVLLGLQKTITDESELTLAKAAYKTIGAFSEHVPNQFQNFAAPLLVTVAKQSLNEEHELAATECLDQLICNLPPITLVEPITVLCSSKHQNTELRNVGLNAALSLPKRFKQTIKGLPNGDGDKGVIDISEMSFWLKLSNCGIESAQSQFSTIRKLGCSLIANLAANSDNQQAIDLILDQLPDTSKRLASAHIRKVRA
jgi:hypothetical protein